MKKILTALRSAKRFFRRENHLKKKLDSKEINILDLQHHFLIAMPHLQDDFYQSVVYVCEHNEKGSMGLVLNHPTDLSIAELYSKLNFMQLNDRCFSDDLVLAGGPMHSERGFILHKKTPQTFQHTYPVNDELCLTTSADIIDTFGTPNAPEKYLVALGCAGWAEKQLEQEIADNAWLVVPANDDILFDLPYDERYDAARRLLGIADPLRLAAQAGHS